MHYRAGTGVVAVGIPHRDDSDVYVLREQVTSPQ